MSTGWGYRRVVVFILLAVIVTTLVSELSQSQGRGAGHQRQPAR